MRMLRVVAPILALLFVTCLPVSAQARPTTRDSATVCYAFSYSHYRVKNGSNGDSTPADSVSAYTAGWPPSVQLLPDHRALWPRWGMNRGSYSGATWHPSGPDSLELTGGNGYESRTFALGIRGDSASGSGVYRSDPGPFDLRTVSVRGFRTRCRLGSPFARILAQVTTEDLIEGLIADAIGVALVAFAAWSALRGRANERWPSTEGRLTAFAPATQRVGRGGFLLDVVFGARKPSVAYSYQLEGRNYMGTTLSVGLDIGDRHPSYSAGSSVRVFYNPENHAQAVLEPGYARMVYYHAVLGLLVIGVSIYWLVA